MQTVNDSLDDVVVSFIDSSYHPEFIPIIASSFTILERFSVPDYESVFINVLAASEMLDPQDVRDLFLLNLRGILLSVLKEHAVQIDEDADVTLAELNEVLFCLLLLQDLEDTSFVSYRLSGAGSSKSKFIDVLARYSTLGMIRAIEVVKGVSDSLIQAILAMCTDSGERRQTDKVHLKYWRDFQEFTQASDCLGKRLYDQGYFGLELSALLSLSGVDLPKHIEQTIKVNPGQASLDLLSTLLLCQDTYQTPLVYMQGNTGVYSTEMDTVTRLRSITTSMLSDFSSELEAFKKEVQP